MAVVSAYIIYSPNMLGCQEVKHFFCKPAVPASWSAWLGSTTNTHTKWCLGNGEWAMEDWVVSRGLRLTDCFVWLTKQRRNNYSVAESSFAVNCQENQRLGCNYHLLPGSGCRLISNGQWRKACGQWTNGASCLSCHQESRMPASAGAVPSHWTWIRGQWNIV